MYGAIYQGSMTSISPCMLEFEDGGTFAANDFVMLSSGVAVVATGGSSILGIAMKAGTDSAADVQINVTPYMRVIMDNDQDSDAFAETDEGLFGDFTGISGGHIVDTSDISTTKANLQVLKYNPQGVGFNSDTSIGEFLVVERQISEQAAA